MGRFKYLTALNEEEEEKLKPSQVAGKEQKKKYQYLSDLNKPFKAPVREEPPKEKEPEPEKKEEKKGIISKISDVNQKFKKGVLKFFFGEKEELISPIAKKPKGVMMDDDQYSSLIGNVTTNKVEAERQLGEKEAELLGLSRSLGIHQIGTNKEEEMLANQVSVLKETIKDYGNFITGESARRGVIKTIFEGVKNPGELLELNKWRETQATSEEARVMKKYESGQKLDKDEMVFLNRHRARTLDSYVKKGAGMQVGEVITKMPSYIMEMAVMNQMAGATGDYKLIGESTTNLLKISSQTGRSIVGKIFDNSIKAAVAGSMSIPSIDSKTAEYMLPNYEIQQNLEGKSFLSLIKSGDDKKAAVSKAYASTMVEYISEGVGDYIDDALPFVKKLFISKWLENKGVTTSTAKLLKKANFNSIVGEVIEEEIGEPFQARIEKRDYKDPFFTPEGRERLLVETLGMAGFSGIARVSDATEKAIKKRRKEMPNDIISLNVAETPEEVEEGIITVPEEVKEPEEPQKPEEVSPTPPPKEVPPLTEVEEPEKPVGEGREMPISEARKEEERINKTIDGLSGEERSKAVEKSNKLREKVNKFREKNKETIIEVPSLKKGFMPLAEIEVVEHDDGTFENRVSTNTSRSGGGVPFSGEFSSKEEAVESGKRKVLEWANKTIRGNDNKTEIKQLNKIIKGIGPVDKKAVKPKAPPKKKAGEVKIPKKPTTDKYYSRSGGEKKFKEVKGKPVDIHKEIDTFIYKREDNKWVVAEGKTGQEMASAKTQKEAIADTKEKIERHSIKKVKDLIETALGKYGHSPRFGGIIKHEQKTPSVHGRKARPKALPHPVRKGKEPARRAKEGPSEPGKPSGRKPAVSKAEPRERPPARISNSQQVEINKEVEKLLAEKGKEPISYTLNEKELLKRYSGAGGLEKSGAKGRGLLDEYYTPKKIVNFIWDKLTPFLKKPYSSLSLLEPSVGTGKFLEQPKQIKRVNGFEINETSATIAHILYPNAQIFNKPFESIFIDERGNKEELVSSSNYEIVVGNPPYGEHRGKYLGLGEEPKIKKYEEYFLKRGLDVLEDGGMLAYVMPSSFLRSSTNYAKTEIGKMARLEMAYRLPNGIFGTTDIGTDVVFFRKGGKTMPSALSNDWYFGENPKDVLGELLKGKGNYGADLIKGTLEEALRMAGYQQKGKIEKAPKPLPKRMIPKEEELDVGRVKAPKTIANKANKKAIISSSKKDATVSLSKTTQEDKELWKNIEATGEFSKSYLSKKFGDITLKKFNNSKMAIDVGVPTKNGSSNKITPSILYYQGNIHEKLDNLEIHKNDIHPKQYSRQKTGLEKVLPAPKKISEITLRPNSNFVKDLKITQQGSTFDVLSGFKEFLRNLPREVFEDTSSWEIDGYIDGKIVNTGDKIRNVRVRRERRRIGDKLFKRFLGEEISSKDIKQIERKYNRAFNAYYKPDYKKVPLLAKINKNFKGETLKMTELQKEGASFLSLKGSGLLGYEVGLGKTLTAIVAVNESLQKGWARKPLIVVPNSVYLQWINEIQEVIPNVKINSLANLGGKFKGDLKTLKVEDGTISLITYSGLSKLGFRMETYDDLTKDLHDVMSGTGQTKRARAKEAEQVGQVVGKAIKGTSGDRFFEDLGFDHLTIDEVHNFKNIFAGAKLPRGKGNEYRNVRGSTSARGIKAYLMTQYILKNNNERNVFLLSATPFTNSPLEVYSIMSLMGKKRLEEIGLKNVNDFMSMFVDMKPNFVVKADQKVKQEDIVERFVNLQQLQKLVTEFIDFRTGEEVGIERPDRRKKTTSLYPTEKQADYVKQAQALFQDKKGGAIVAITELQNITLSPYMSRYSKRAPTYKQFVENSPKVKFAVEAVAQNKKDKKEVGQVIYMPRGVQFFPLVKQYLIKEKKFKNAEIGIIKGGMTVDAKYSVQNSFNKGKIKVLIGTEAIKEGVNLQENATDLYHLHLPWNPTDMLQIEGRVWRQGNKWKNVRIHYPLIENSVDSFIFQKLETKEKRIKNLWSYKTNSVNVGDLDFEGMKLDLITDPVIKVEAEESFVTEKEEIKLRELESERAFISRKTKAVEKIKEELKDNKGWLADARKQKDDDNVDYYSKRVKESSKKLVKAKKELTEQGLDLVEMKTKTKKFDIKIKAQAKIIEGLEAKFHEKRVVAERKRISTIVKDNDFGKIIGKIAEENKTFFVKRKVLRAKYKAPSAKHQAKKAPEGAFFLKRKPETETETARIKVATTPEGLKTRIEQLNKFAQANAILRKAGGIKKRKAVGQFIPKREVRLKASYISNDADYVEALAHELGHSIEYNLSGKINDPKFKVFGDNLSEETIAKITKELKAVTHELVGDEITDRNRQYYYKPSELLARFLQKRFVSPSNLGEIAPTANELLDSQSVKHPMIREFLEAADNEIDKGVSKFKFLRDLRQTYQRFLGKRVGNIAYNREVVHRAMQERAKITIEKFLKKKFKKVKDSPAMLFRAAEGIKATKGGTPEFGTRDFVTAKNKKEAKTLKEEGWQKVRTEVRDGKAYPVFARQRYTPQEAEVIFESLSEKGQQLIKDFTAARSEAKDYFNREVIKDVHKVQGNIEGWVHHYFEERPTGGLKSLKFRKKRAGTRAKRKGKEGYVEDFKKAMSKVLVDLGSEKAFNDFISDQFATVTKPIPAKQNPDKGWVEVVGDIEKGVGLKQEKKVVVIKDGKAFVPKRIRYQMPKDIYQRYKLWKGLIDEASTAVKIVNDINRYWRINVLAHLGTAGTNFISGGIQYSTKVLTDFYTETLTGKIGYKQTRKNVGAILKTLLPKGWSEAPDWVYGGDLSSWYGQFTKQPGIVSKGIQKYGNNALKVFSAYERYWKKVISISENSRDLKKLGKITKRGLRPPTKLEKQLIADINKEVDLYAYDYDNVPTWLEAYQRSAVWQAIKPFAKYPYKYAKHVMNLTGAIFDGSLPWQERAAKLLSLTTVMGLYAAYAYKRREEQETPEPTEKVPERLSVRGRLYATTKDGKELFIKVAKYPFINLSQVGLELADGSWESGKDLFNDMVASIGVGGKLAALAGGYRHDYDRYKPVPALLGENITTFIPGFRVLGDISRMLDPFRRTQKTFGEAIGRIVPTTDEDLQRKLHGEIRTVRVPIEGKIKRQKGEKRKRTTTDRVLRNYWQDILIGALTGIYISRIDPEEVKAIIIREEKNRKEKEKKEKKEKK